MTTYVVIIAAKGLMPTLKIWRTLIFGWKIMKIVFCQETSEFSKNRLNCFATFVEVGENRVLKL